MLSFKIISEEFENENGNIFFGLKDEEIDYVKDIVDGYSSFASEGEMEFAVCVSAGCLCTRVFDYGRYYFLAPVELSDDADVKRAYLEVLEYARREEIPLQFHEVTTEHFSTLLEFIRHMDVDAEGVGGESFHVRIKNECEFLESVPELDDGELVIRGLREDDASLYGALCRDKSVNKNFGYSPTNEYPNATDGELVELALAEFDRGLGIPLALEYRSEFIGDALLYAFDGMGSAEFAIRLLPDKQGRGLGTLFLDLLFEYAANIGLLKITAYVKKENPASLAMCSKFMEKISDDGDRVFFSKDLTL